ncbi:hypothetical protein HUU61_18955 [Rhodopseudomonas palustris]|nr:hypothetical protein [Rhodopseudomonas palustris]
MSEASSAITPRQALRLFGRLRLRLTRPTKNAFAVPDVAALILATDRDKSRRCDSSRIAVMMDSGFASDARAPE